MRTSLRRQNRLSACDPKHTRKERRRSRRELSTRWKIHDAPSRNLCLYLRLCLTTAIRTAVSTESGKVYQAGESFPGKIRSISQRKH